MKELVLTGGEYYHIYSRGVRKTQIFHDERDYIRFTYLLLHFQGEYYPSNISSAVSNFVRCRSFQTRQSTIEKIVESRGVSLVAFTLMSNHLHLGLYAHKDGGISNYMKRVLGAYAKYYNEKYKETGHLFQGKFGRVHISSNEQFLHTTAYIHLNQTELKGWKRRELKYPWSSFQDYKENRWGDLLDRTHILEQFDKSDDYIDWVNKSGAKGVGLDYEVGN